MKKNIFIFMIIGALLCVLYMGVAAETEPNQEPTSSASSQTESQPEDQGGEISEDTSSQDTSSQDTSSQNASSQDSSSQEVSSEEIVSQEVSSEEEVETSSTILGTVSIEVTTSNVSYETTTETSSKVISEEPSSSEKTSSKYGYNAVDPTVGNYENDFDDPASDMSIDLETTSEENAEDEGGEKNIFNLSKVLKGLIFIPIVLALASVGALVYVNRKEFAGAKAKKTDKKETSGKDARKKNNK